MGFQHKDEAETFLQSLHERFGRFGLALHPDKTRLIEFGRFAAHKRQRRGLGKPEFFNFPVFTHYCERKRLNGGFIVNRVTMDKRMTAKLKVIRETLCATDMNLRGLIPLSTLWARLPPLPI